jgi:ElaB/YqjD/DUF883 family membrane-anchored ribosome-binding protein
MNTQNNQTKEKAKQFGEDTHSLLTAAAHDASDVVEAARTRLQPALDAASETCDQLKAKAVDSAKAADKIIRANPYQAAAVAFGVGAFIGFLLSRRSRD